MGVEERLAKVKRELDRVRTQRAQEEGRLAESQERLEKEFGLKTDRDVERELARLDKEIAKLGTQLEEGLRKLEEALA